MKSLTIKTLGLSLSALTIVTYVLCVIWDAIFPGWAMYRVWQGLFPGFEWSIGGFLIGLVEAALYGFYPALVFVPIYHYLQQRERQAIPSSTQTEVHISAHH